MVDAVDGVAAARGVPSAQVALAWLLHKPGVTAPIVGSTKEQHLKDALAAEELTLGDDEIERAREALRRPPGARALLRPHAPAGPVQ